MPMLDYPEWVHPGDADRLEDAVDAILTSRYNPHLHGNSDWTHMATQLMTTIYAAIDGAVTMAENRTYTDASIR